MTRAVELLLHISGSPAVVPQLLLLLLLHLMHISGSPAVVPQLLLLLHLIQPRQHTNSLQRDES